MPKFLEKKLMAEYGDKSTAFKVMNSIGAVRGNKITAKGEAMQAKHDAKMPKAGKAASLASHPNASRLGKWLHPKKSR